MNNSLPVRTGATGLMRIERCRAFLHPLLQELYTCLVTSNKNAYENGQTWARQQFDRMVHGQISLKDFAEYMKMNPKEITAKVVFSLPCLLCTKAD